MPFSPSESPLAVQGLFERELAGAAEASPTREYVLQPPAPPLVRAAPAETRAGS